MVGLALIHKSSLRVWTFLNVHIHFRSWITVPFRKAGSLASESPKVGRGRSTTREPRSLRPAGVGSSHREVFLTAVLAAAEGTEWEDLWNLTKPSPILTKPGDSGFCFHRGVGREPPRLTSPHLAVSSLQLPDNTTQALTRTRTPQAPCPTRPPGCNEASKEPLPQITAGSAVPAVLGRRETGAPPRKRKRAPASAHR